MAEFVTVGCKLPNGLIIHVGDDKVSLNGQNSSNVIGGHGLTQVDKDFWDVWILDHADFTPVKAGLIFAQSNEKKASSEAIEKEANLSGFEGLNPKAPAPGIAPDDGQ